MQFSKPKASMDENCPFVDWPPSIIRPGGGVGSIDFPECLSYEVFEVFVIDDIMIVYFVHGMLSCYIVIRKAMTVIFPMMLMHPTQGWQSRYIESTGGHPSILLD